MSGNNDYVTKDSGNRESFGGGMVRDTNEGKARFDLLWPQLLPYEQQLLTRVAMLMARGAQKYGERNWEKACDQPALERYQESGLRHHFQHLGGDTEEDHAAAVVFNLIGEEYVKWRLAQQIQAGTEADEGGCPGGPECTCW